MNYPYYYYEGVDCVQYPSSPHHHHPPRILCITIVVPKAFACNLKVKKTDSHWAGHKIYRLFLNPKCHYVVYNNPQLNTILSQLNPVNTSFFFLLMSPSRPLSFSKLLFLPWFITKIFLFIYQRFLAFYVSSPFSFILIRLLLLYLYRARNKITQLSIPTYAQLQRHRLKFIRNHLKKLLHVSVFGHLQGVTMSSLKSLLLLTTVGCFCAKSGDVAACL